jgi:outer membrane protein TolC
MVLIAGCMVGPKYKQPATPVASAYKEQSPQMLKESNQWKVSHPNNDALRSK